MPEKTQSFIEKFGERAIIFICLGLGGWWLQNQWNATQEMQKSLASFREFVDTKYVDKEVMGLIDATHSRRFDKLDDKLDKAMNMIREINTRNHSHPKLYAPSRRLEDIGP